MAYTIHIKLLNNEAKREVFETSFHDLAEDVLGVRGWGVGGRGGHQNATSLQFPLMLRPISVKEAAKQAARFHRGSFLPNRPVRVHFMHFVHFTDFS